jgi:hypothetical protein
MAVYRRGKTRWYEFLFAGRRARESAKATSKTVAKEVEKKRHRELEEGFNVHKDTRDDRIKTVLVFIGAALSAGALRVTARHSAKPVTL